MSNPRSAGTSRPRGCGRASRRTSWRRGPYGVEMRRPIECRRRGGYAARMWRACRPTRSPRPVLGSSALLEAASSNGGHLIRVIEYSIYLAPQTHPPAIRAGPSRGRHAGGDPRPRSTSAGSTSGRWVVRNGAGGRLFLRPPLPQAARGVRPPQLRPPSPKAAPALACGTGG